MQLRYVLPSPDPQSPISITIIGSIVWRDLEHRSVPSWNSFVTTCSSCESVRRKSTLSLPVGFGMSSDLFSIQQKTRSYWAELDAYRYASRCGSRQPIFGHNAHPSA